MNTNEQHPCKNFIFLIALLFSFSSCTERLYYQVCSLTSEQTKDNGEAMTYENEDVSLSYNFFANGGCLSFAMTNKTDKMLYVVMPESFFIRNGVAHDYYQGIRVSFNSGVSSGTSTVTASVSDKYFAGVMLRYNSFSFSQGYTKEEQKIVAIPPHTTKFIQSYSVMNKVYLACSKEQDFPNKKSNAVFTPTSTPLAFTNRIAYTFEKDGESGLKYIDNAFYISQITNYAPWAAFEKVKVTDCLGIEKRQKEYVFYAPNNFFIPYNQDGIYKTSELRNGNLSVRKIRK